MKDLMEVGPLSREVMSPFGSTPIRSITGRLSLFPSSLTRNPINSPYGLPSLNSGEITGLPRSAYISSDGLGAVFPPVGLRLRQRISKSLNLPTYLLVQAYQRLWLVGIDDIYQQFTSVDRTILSWLPTALTLAVATFPSRFRDHLLMRLHCPRGSAPHRYQ